MNNLVPEYLSEELDLQEFYEIFGGRPDTNTGGPDPSISQSTSFYCEGQSPPTDYSIIFRDVVGLQDRFTNILPRWFRVSDNQPHISGGDSIYCLFTPIN